MKETFKRIISILLIFAALLSITACSASPDREDTAATHVVTDHNGNAVTVPTDIQRIVVCDIYPLPSVLAIFFDSASKLVGIPQQALAPAKAGLLGQLYPEILNAQTDYINGTEVDTEKLMNLQPDVIFYSAGDEALGEQLRSAGFAALAVSPSKWNYDCIETLDHWIELLNELFPKNSKGDTVAAYAQKQYDFVQERIATLPEDEKEDVFFLFQYNDSTLLSSGSKSFGHFWANAIGANDVAGDLEANNSVAVTLEQIYAWNPSVILMTNFNTSLPDDLYNNTVGSYVWDGIDAIEAGRVYKMPLGMYRSYTLGVDTPVTLLWLAQTVYPELFSDVDILSETKNYYKEVFSIELTDEQAESIFAPAIKAGSGF